MRDNLSRPPTRQLSTLFRFHRVPLHLPIRPKGIIFRTVRTAGGGGGYGAQEEEHAPKTLTEGTVWPTSAIRCQLQLSRCATCTCETAQSSTYTAVFFASRPIPLVPSHLRIRPKGIIFRTVRAAGGRWGSLQKGGGSGVQEEEHASKTPIEGTVRPTSAIRCQLQPGTCVTCTCKIAQPSTDAAFFIAPDTTRTITFSNKAQGHHFLHCAHRWRRGGSVCRRGSVRLRPSSKALPGPPRPFAASCSHAHA